MTVLLVAHVLGDLAQLCSRVGVLVNGRLDYVGPVDKLARDPATGKVCPLEQALEKRFFNGKVTSGK